MLSDNKKPPNFINFFLPNRLIFFPKYKDAAAPLTGNKDVINPIMPISQFFYKAILGKNVLGIR